MKKTALLLTAILIAVGLLHSQQNHICLASRFDKQRQLYPQEKLYVHTDRSKYMPGDRIWLRAYVIDATSFLPLDADRYLYVELTDSNGFVIRRVKVSNINSSFSGYIDIPQQTEFGCCYLRSYTLYSANLRGYECIAPINIGIDNDVKPYGQVSGEENQTGPLLCEDIGSAIRLQSAGLTAGQHTLAVVARGCVINECDLKPGTPVVFRKKDMPEGISQFLMIDDSHRIIDRKAVFSPYGGETMKVGIDAPLPSDGDSITLTLCIPQPLSASLSVSVTTGMKETAPSIIPQILLSQEIKGGVAYADRFFDKGCDIAGINSLLRHAVYDRYPTDSVIAGRYTIPPSAHETTQTITGTAIVTAPYARMAAYAKISVISPDVNMFAFTDADAKGRFTITGLDYPAGAQFAVNAAVGNTFEKTAVDIDEIEFPKIDRISLDTQKGVGYSGDTVADAIPSSIALRNVNVTAIQQQQHSGTFSAMADFSMTSDQLAYIDATCIHEVLRRIPGIYMKGDTAYVRSKISVYGKSQAAIAIDGVILDGDYDLDIIQMQDVERIDVFKSGSAAIWGAKGGPGVISITLKNGTTSNDDSILNHVSKFTPLGYQPPLTEHCAGNCQETTIYWNGNVKMMDGKACVTFPAWLLPQDGTFSVQAEGVADSGILLHGRRTLNL